MMRLIFSILFLSLCVVSFGQSAPDKISYQAVVRDNFGNELANQTVSIEFAIRQDSPTGTIVFEEVHNLIPTNQFGLFTAMIGDGIPTGVGLFTQLFLIPWENHSHFLEVRATIPGTGEPQIIGVSQLLTVPYAFYASRAGSVINESDGDTQNELIDDFSLSGTVLTITENNTDYSVDLGSLGSGSEDVTNELITDVALNSQFELDITEGSNTQSVDLSPIAHATWQENTNAVYNNTDNIGVGTANPTSTFDVQGSMAMKVTSLVGQTINLNANLAVASSAIFLCDVTTQDVNITLVSASTCPGRIYKFRKRFTGDVTSNDVNLVAQPGELVDGFPIYQMTHIYSEYLTIVSDGANWYAIDHSKD